MSIRSARHLYGVWGASADVVYAAGIDGLVLHYDGSLITPEKIIEAVQGRQA